MKKIFVVLIFFTLCIPVYSQVETIYFPQESIYTYMGITEKDCDFSKVIRISHPENNSLLKNDTIDREEKKCQFGMTYKVHYSLEDGTWKNTNGGRIWTLTVESTGASSIGFSFSKFRLPNGARLYISNHNESALYGPVTKDAIAEQKEFATNIIPGERVSIFLFEPNNQKGKSELEISKLYHETINTADSGMKDNCRIHVPCVPGWNLEADATGSIRDEDEDFYYYGSGALVMTTDNSYKGYFLTAKHVIDDRENYSVTFFNRQTACNGNNTYSTITCNNIVLRASWQNTDMALMEILDLPTNNGRIAWLGWDRTGMNSNNNATIHYPYDDTANISIDDDNLSTYNTYFWRSTLDMGIMAGGSSGAPLLNQNRRIIGQEKGFIGNAPTECDQINNVFGKFSLSWTGGGTDDTRLSNWLDPYNTGVTVMPSSFDINILGESNIYSSNVYTTSPMPSFYSVYWYLTGANASCYTVHNNTPSTNQCTIIKKDSVDFVNTNDLVLNAQIKYGSTVITTVTKPLTPFFYIYGPTVPYSTSSYEIGNLPDDCTVSWNWSGTGLTIDNTPILVEPYYSTNNYFKLVRNNLDYARGTLTATINRSGNTVATISKTLDTGVNFSGTWYQGTGSSSTLTCGNVYSVTSGSQVHLYSNDFIGKAVTYSNHGLFLLSGGVSHSGNTISFTPVLSVFHGDEPYAIPYLGKSVTIQVTDATTYEAFEFTFYIEPQHPSNPPILSMAVSGNEYTFTYDEASESRQTWALEVVKIDTGQVVYDGTTDMASQTIMTSNWQSGIYAVLVRRNGQIVATQKITIQ